MAGTGDPAIARRKLSERLRTFRSMAGLSREQAAAELDWSHSKVVRIETAVQGVSSTDVAAMLSLYGVEDGTVIGELTELARVSRRPPWWSRHRDRVSKQLSQLLSLEPLASSVRTFHPLLIPGVLHTEDYAYALLRLTQSDEAARPLVELRIERQRRLLGQTAADITFLFGEEALLRRVGSVDTMRGQLRYLREISEGESAEVRIVPLSADAHPGLGGPFTLLELRETSENLLFMESAGGDFAIKDDEAIIAFGEIFERLRKVALSSDDTRELIDRYLAELEAGGESGS